MDRLLFSSSPLQTIDANFVQIGVKQST